MPTTTPQQLRKDAADLREMVRRDPHSAARQASQKVHRDAQRLESKRGGR